MNDGEVTYFMFTGQKPKNIKQATEIISEEIYSEWNEVFIIEEKKSGKPIGTVGLYEIHPTARKAEFRVLIGEKDFWGKGYGTEATEMATFYGFDRLNLMKIYLGSVDENQGAKKAYEKAGYKEEGILRKEVYRNSKYYDAIRMGMLRDEYYEELYEKHSKRFK